MTEKNERKTCKQKNGHKTLKETNNKKNKFLNV